MERLDPTNLQARIDRIRRLAEAAGRGPIAGICPECDGTGWRPVDGGVRVERCPCWIERQPAGMAAMATKCGVGEAFAGFTLASFDAKFGDDKAAKRFLAWARLWADTDPASRSDAVLLGPNGTGKTGLAIAMLRAVIERGETGWFTELDTLSIRYRATFDRHDDEARETEADLFDALSTFGTLVVDEVTGTKATDFVEDKLRSIVVARQRAKRPTLLTLNVPAYVADDADKIERAIVAALGPTLFDKLRERAQFFPMFGPSKRRSFTSLPGGRI